MSSQKEQFRTTSSMSTPPNLESSVKKPLEGGANIPPPHLSEFYSFMNNKSNISISPHQSPSIKESTGSEYRGGRRVTRQPSLNTFTSFTPSVLDLPHILTSKDFEQSVKTYENTLDKAGKFRMALLAVSKAAEEFGQALEDTIDENPKVNNSKQVSDGLINAGSLQYIVGSNNQILARLLTQNFEEPLTKELNHLKDNYSRNYDYYQQEIKAKSRALRLKELENLKLSKLKTRNLTVYKNNLVNLTNQLDEIDRLKYDYYHEVNSMVEHFNSEQLLIRTGSIIRAELELFEGVARKGWSGGGLDRLLAVSPDLFAIDYTEDELVKNVTGEEDTDVANSRHSGMHSIIEDDESCVSDEEIQHNYTSGGFNETMETVKLGSNAKAESVDNVVIERDASPSKSDDVIKQVSTPYTENNNDNLDTPVRSLQELQLDESFSLPKVNNDSLRNSLSRNEFEPDKKEEDVDNSNILNGIDE